MDGILTNSYNSGSLAGTAKANGIDPCEYLLLVLSLIPGAGKAGDPDTLASDGNAPGLHTKM